MKSRKVGVVAAAMAATSLLVAAALAVPPGKNVTFKGGGMGKVVFSGTVHAKAGKCATCHPKLFKQKIGGDKITMKAIYAGQFCGACHNGKKAFAAKANCAKCHKK